MNSKLIFTVLSLLFFTIFIGLSVLTFRLFLSGNSLMAFSIFIGILVLAFIFVHKAKKIYADINSGLAFEDERSQRVRMYAAGHAYFISIYLWLVLLVFRNQFDRDDLILTGLFGMAISFAISWITVNKMGFE